jgi:hypothetical protein
VDLKVRFSQAQCGFLELFTFYKALEELLQAYKPQGKLEMELFD